MKKALFLLTVFSIVFTFVSCFPNDKDSDNNEIYYSLNQGVKISDLSEEKQNSIQNFVEDCKVLYTNSYKGLVHTAEYINSPYISFSDVFVYDFENCDLNSSNKTDINFWNNIKKLREDDKTPILYIELNGYLKYYSDTLINKINEAGIICGFFIYDDNSVVPYMLKNIFSVLYKYELPTSTTMINCGNKFSEELSFTKDSLANYNKEMVTLVKYEK